MHTLCVESAVQEQTDEDLLNISLTQLVAPVNALTDDKWSVCVTILSQEVPFRIDTGAKCNMLTLDSYQRLMHTGELKCSQTQLRCYSNHELKPVAAVDLTVKHKNRDTTAEFEIARLDSLQEAAEAKKRGPVKDSAPPETVPEGLSDFPELVRTTGMLPGKYTIKIEPPAALKEKIVQKLQEMAEDGYITKVEQPTEWVSSMVAVTRGGKIRICIDPSDLNKVIRREHYPMHTVEEVVSSMPGAKVFSVLDAKSG